MKMSVESYDKISYGGTELMILTVATVVVVDVVWGAAVVEVVVVSGATVVV